MMKMKKITALVLTFALIFSLTGCGEIQKAESAVKGMFAAFKNLDFEEAEKYIDLKDITDENVVDENAEIVMKAIFENLNYEIISSEKVDDSTVLVKTKITATDMKPVMTDFFQQVMQYAFSNALTNPEASEEALNKKIEEILVECATKPDLATVTNEVDIKVIKNDNDEWKIEADDTFVDATLGGLINVAKEIENSFNFEN